MTERKYRYIEATEHRGSVLVASITEPKLRDATTCYALRDELIGAIDSAAANTLVLDLKPVDFIGSIGFLAFLSARRHMGGGRVILCSMSENVREMFRVCGLLSPGTSQQSPFEEAESVELGLGLAKEQL